MEKFGKSKPHFINQTGTFWKSNGQIFINQNLILEIKKSLKKSNGQILEIKQLRK